MLSISMAMAVRCKMLLVRLLNLVRFYRWQAALWGRCKKIINPLPTAQTQRGWSRCRRRQKKDLG